MTVLDDGYETDSVTSNIVQLIHQHQATAIVGNVGTPAAVIAAPMTNTHGVVFYGAFTGADILRKSPPDPYVFNFRASYRQEMAAAALDKIGFHQLDRLLVTHYPCNSWSCCRGYLFEFKNLRAGSRIVRGEKMHILSIVVLVVAALLMNGCQTNQGDTVPEIPEVAKTIDFNTVKWYAARASAAYKTEDEIKAAFPDTVRVKQVGNTQVQYFLEFDHDEKRQIISVRGTDNLKNVKEDVEYIKSKNEKLDIFVHKGFDEDTIKIYQDILPLLNKDYTVRLTGHSLGAAISTLLMIYLYEDGFEIEKSINFGQPKVTNKAGVKRYHFLPLTRVVNENDVVPLLPPVTLLSALHGIYKHMGDEVISLKGVEYIYLEQHQSSKEKVEGFWENIDHESVEEHFMDNYLKNIDSKLTDAVEVPYVDREVYLDRHED